MKRKRTKYLVITGEMGFGRSIRVRIETMSRKTLIDWLEYVFIGGSKYL